MTFKPRPAQQAVLDYQGGMMGICAVPGSGKTQTLSHLAADLIASDRLEDDQEVLVVTLVNSAVNNFYSRVRALVDAKDLLPNVGYQVRTLHGLAHDIVRQRPGLVGLADGFVIIDERAADLILDDVVKAWVRVNPNACDAFLSPTLSDGSRDWVRRDKWPQWVKSIAKNYIKRAKDLRQSPTDIAAHLGALSIALPLAEMGYALYEDYQRALAYRGAVDFDDLMRLAHQALTQDPEYLARLQRRWPYILEDEAQDSSQIQEKILRLLVGDNGNWVRVGDPNQAIYETFTTANPQFLRDFLDHPNVVDLTLPNSGRSTLSVIRLANHLIDWAQHEHPNPQVSHALSPPHIEPTPPDDPQPNPPDKPDHIHLVERAYSPEGEIKAIADSLERWLPKHPDKTVAVLVPRNDRGARLSEELRKRHIDHVELLQSTVSTRHTAGALANLLNYLGNPKASKLMETAFRVWRRADREDEQANQHMVQAAKRLRSCQRVEAFVWPQPDQDWLEADDEAVEEIRQLLEEFRQLARRWQAAALLPIDQLLLTLAQDLFREPAELALSHKLALMLKRAARLNPEWRLPELGEELKVIATNERRFIGFSDDDMGFDPDKYKGVVVVTTMHRAKGLEWDRVHLMSVNNYDFPSAQPYDQYLSERWFIRDQLNLDAETQAQLALLGKLDEATLMEEDLQWTEGAATLQARIDYTAERLRLFYVGITRARRELIVTWNTGRSQDQKKTSALPLVALRTFWEGDTP